MVPSSILQRVFHARHNRAEGTVFTVDVARRQYIATAKHVIEGLEPNTELSISRGGGWETIRIGEIWHPPTGADIALVGLKNLLSPATPIRIGDPTSFFLSQQIYFLGFPYGLQTQAGQSNNGYPIPFVKTGIIASFSEVSAGSQLIYCDGHNNPGFSGGPVITVANDHSVTIIAIVSSYESAKEKILLNGIETGLTYQANTGLIVGYGVAELLTQAMRSTAGAPIA